MTEANCLRSESRPWCYLADWRIRDTVLATAEVVSCPAAAVSGDIRQVMTGRV